MHPDVHLKMEEAQILFALAQSAISGIVLDITKIKEASSAKVNGEPIPTPDLLAMLSGEMREKTTQIDFNF